MNIDKYINNVEQTSNGYCYKDIDAFNTEFNKVCYISEYSIDDLQEMHDNGNDATDTELIADNTAYTRNTIRQTILDYLLQYDEKYTLNDVINHELDVIVFQECDWQSPQTFILDCALEETIH